MNKKKKDKINRENEIQFEKGDITAMIIAIFQLLLPYVILVVLVYTAFIFFSTQVWLG